MADSAIPPEVPERWLPVVGYEGLYDISGRGNVYSRRAGRMLRPSSDTDGYLCVGLCRDGQQRNVKVHRLVLEAFAGSCPPGMEACHGPGGKRDNRPENLCWGTRQKNQGDDRRRDGTSSRGEQHGRAKLTVSDVTEIRRRVAGGETRAVVAREFGVDPSTVGLAVSRKTWSHC